MNAIDRPAPAASVPVAAASAPRIRYIDPLALGSADFEAALDHAAAQGFTAVMLPPPWAPDRDGDRFAPATLERVHPGLGGGGAEAYIRKFAGACRKHGLLPMLDLPIASISSAFEGDAAPFAPALAGNALDPRGGGPARTRPVADPQALGHWWAGRLAGWAVAGLAGVRVLGLEHAPASLADLHHSAPAMTLIAWTPGLPRAALSQLRHASYVVSSQAWWDYTADWLWDELEALRQVAPVLACPEVPFGVRVGSAVHDPARLAATLRRAAALACITGDGWLVPTGFETGARAMDVTGRAGTGGASLPDGRVDVSMYNRHIGRARAGMVGTQLLSGAGSTPLAVLRTDAADARFARQASVSLLKPTDGCPALDAAVRAHRWIPTAPHAGVLAEMERQDVLVFPSLFEGFGLVILEAMSRGLPVITTAHTAGPDFIADGNDGFLVPIRSAPAIAEKLELLHREPARLAAMREAARAKATARTWDAYRRQLVECLRPLLEPSAP